jgi:type I restriction enzyme S subunit
MSEGDGLPKGWQACTIGQITCSVKNGIYKPKDFYSADGTPCLRMYNIEDGRLVWEGLKRMTLTVAEQGEYGLIGGDIVVNRVNSRELVGKACVIPDGLGVAVFESKNIRLRVWKEACLPAYLNYWFLLAGRHYFSANAQQTVGMASVNQEQLSAFGFPLAPLPEQHRIVEKIEELFSDLDAGVTALQRAKANLKRYRASVLKSAVEGRLTEEWRKEHPQAEDGQMLLDRILRERREKWEKDQLAQFKKKGKEPPKNWQSKYEEPSAPDTSVLPELPEGWVWATVEQVSVVVRGSSPRPAGDPRYFGGSVPWITVGPITADNEPYLKAVPEGLTEEGRENSRFIEPHTLLLTNSGATLGVPKITLIGGCINDGVAALLETEYPLKLYLLYFLHTQTASLRGVNQGAAQPNLNTSIIKAIWVTLPPLAEQEQIVALVEERLSQIDSAERTIDAELIRAKRLRQSILKQAFEGKLVPQDPKDEPASVLLERIKASREAEQPKKKAKKAKAK